MMNHKTTRTWAVMIAAALALSLLLTACGTGGDTPTGDDSTPGVTDTDQPGTETPSNTPDTTIEPSNTPDAPKEPVTLLPDPVDINEEYLEHIHGGYTIDSLGGAEAVDNMLDEIYEKYGQYLNENISKNCVIIGIFAILSFDEGAGEITPEALKEVNDLLKSNGKEPLDTKDAEQKIAAFWLAASLYYDPDYRGDEFQQRALEKYPGWRLDIGHAFALAKYSKPEDVRSYEELFAGDHANLFNIPYNNLRTNL